MDDSGLDCISRPAGLDSCVAPRPGLSPHDKATLAIDAIDNKLPNRSTLPFEFFELAVIALQKSTDDARTAVQQRNKTIDELRALCNSLKECLRALSMPPPAAPPTASSPGSMAVHPVESLHKPPKVSAPQSPARAATSALPYSPTSPVALSAWPSDASVDIAHSSSVPTPPAAPLAVPSGAAVGSNFTPSPASYGCRRKKPNAMSTASPYVLQSIPTPPAALVAPSASPFLGHRGTKPNELHLQFKSCAEFNTKLACFYENNVIAHWHSLLEALVSAICSRFDKDTESLFTGNRLRAAFWSPRGNLIIHFLRSPSPELLAFFLSTLTEVCGAKDFVVLNRPAVSALKLSKVPTSMSNNTPTDLQQLSLDLLSTPQFKGTAFFHTP